MIKFYVPIEIQPKQADRSALVAGFIKHYQPKKVTGNAESIAALARDYRPEEPLMGPLAMCLDFWWSWPKSFSQKKREQGRIPRDTKPDFDNCSKQVCDVLQRMGFFKNDSQLSDVRVRKWWGPQTGIEIELSAINFPHERMSTCP